MSQETNIPQEIAPVLAPLPDVQKLGQLAAGLQMKDQETGVFEPDWQPTFQLSKEALPAIATPDKPSEVVAVRDDDEPIPVPVVSPLTEHAAAHVQRAHRPTYFEEPPRPRGRHAR